jgi:SNF2 family DNA or RNA helicase
MMSIKSKELIAIVRPDWLFELDWQSSELDPDSVRDAFQKDAYALYNDNHGSFLLWLGFSDLSTIPMSESLRYLQFIASFFIKKLSRDPDAERLRERIVIALDEEEAQMLMENTPYLSGNEYINLQWLEQVWVMLQEAFADTIKKHKGSVEEWLSTLNPNIHLVGRIFFHLVESKNEDAPFSFLATYAMEISPEGKSRHQPLKHALVQYQDDNRKLLALLSTVNKAAVKSTIIPELIDSGEIFHPLEFTTEEAYTFLKEIPLYEEAGIVCRIPKWWRSRSNPLKLSVSVGDKQPSRVGFDALMDFHAELSLDGEQLAPETLRQLLAEAEGLVYLKGKWVEVNHKKLQAMLKAYEKAQQLTKNPNMSLMDAMRFQLTASELLDVPDEVGTLEVTNGQWLDSIVQRLMHPDTIEPITHGGDFHASLRPYQEKGMNWLYLMKSLGLGACLADDMGLGKTVQIIALLNSIRMRHREHSLLVVPASLINNWMSEITKFAPALKFFVLHPSENPNVEYIDSHFLKQYDLVIITYGMLHRYDWLKEIQWDTLILDEAQAIKNPGTKQTRTVKQLKARCRIAMTGTPIENRLADLWSLFDFLNEGLLGTSKQFAAFIKQLRETSNGYSRLKQVVSPFILRRLKTDKAVISDLPDKIEMKTYAALSKKQLALYNKLVEELREKMETVDEGRQRKGLILSSIMKFKQLCNHPDQYLGQQQYAEEDSGKFNRLREICETIHMKRERVLVFTQFKEITESLRNYLEQIFQHKGLVLHGETPVSKRKDIVAQFQGQDYVPFMVLSIKAGGVGLNLTSANHVIHFDRWWNPAVENQATDRAFRIGQEKNVVVHKFITKGTIEEKIDQMIEDKIKLSSEIIPDLQESWITELDNRQLIDLFKLSP